MLVFNVNLAYALINTWLYHCKLSVIPSLKLAGHLKKVISRQMYFREYHNVLPSYGRILTYF